MRGERVGARRVDERIRAVVPSYALTVTIVEPFAPRTADETRRPSRSYVETEFVTTPQSCDSVTTYSMRLPSAA